MSHELESQMPGRRQDQPLQVGQLNWFIKNIVENSVPRVWVEGEVSDLSRPSSGHLYFSLKDNNSQIRSVIWRTTAENLKFDLKDGLSVLCQGTVEVYQPRGSYQLILNQVQPLGVGPLQLAFQQLHQKLSAEGLFEPSRKRPLPKLPKRIALVTSLSGAAVHDFLEASRDRWGCDELTIVPTRVQGETAAMEIVQALRQVHRVKPRFDLIVLGRGGGSMEDLWCFNDEQVVRAISKCRIPVVSAVGHEVDVSLSDMAADARALTPSHAGQLILPSRQELSEQLAGIARRLRTQLQAKLQSAKTKLESFQKRGILARPHQLHIQKRQLVDDLEVRARNAIQQVLETRKQQLQSIARATEALSPLQVLSRGYSLTHAVNTPGVPLTKSQQVQVGDEIETTLAQGQIRSKIVELQEAPKKAGPAHQESES